MYFIWIAVVMFALPTNQFHNRAINVAQVSAQTVNLNTSADTTPEEISKTPLHVAPTFRPYQEHRPTQTPIDIMPNFYKEIPQRIKAFKGIGGRKGSRHHHHHRHHHGDYDYDGSYRDSDESDEDDNELESDYHPHIGIRRYKRVNKTRTVPKGISDPISTIAYNLYTKRHSKGLKIFKTAGLNFGEWSKNRSVKVIIHSFYSNFWRSPEQLLDGPEKIISAYLSNHDNVNVVLCNWTTAAAMMSLDIENGPQSIKQVGEDLADFLIHLFGAGRINQWADVHLIGFGLGAHIAGVAGWFIQKYNGGLKLGRITGLDPANAGYDTFDGNTPLDSSGILDRSDADFVDVIHCNQGSYSNAMLGSVMISGHADFYPNGGNRQPGCEDSRRSLCSHERCLTFFASSFNSHEFKACQCPSWDTFINWQCNCANQPVILMGDSCPNTARGLYFLRI